jgi:serine phosphatase RsbU (regulator of sigma subunit)
VIDRSSIRNCCFLFEVLSEEETAYLLAHSTVREYPPDALLFKEGDRSEHFSLVLEGQVAIIKSLGAPLERLVKVLSPGEYLGEMSLVYENHNRTASARALSTARLLEIPIADFEPLVRRTPRLAYQLMQTLIERVIENENATIRDLEENNRLLIQSLAELQEAQSRLIARERLETELATAFQIQKSMMPSEIPNLPGWELVAHWQPAREVSGDFYDFIPLPDGRIALVVGDVTDKGVPAALLMTVTRSTVRTAAVTAASPGELLARANDILCPQMPFSMFATCQVAFLDPAAGRLELANAGHPLPLLYRGGQVREIHATGLVLGLFPGMEYEVKEERLEAGDRVLFYSDGLSEAHNPSGVMLSSAGVTRLFCQGIRQPAPLIEYLLQQFTHFTGPNATLEDDITLVDLRRL